MTENTHKVYAKQWAKWTEAQRVLFNMVYEDIQAMGSVFVPFKLSPHDFNVLAWNSAFVAASNLKNIEI